MSLAPMRTRVSFVLSVVALAQVALLGLSLGLLLAKLHEVRTNLTRLEREEHTFLNQLGGAESNLYRASILLRDYIILDGPELQRAKVEMADLLRRISQASLDAPPWISPQMRDQVLAVEATRREYLARAETVAHWKDRERRSLGPLFLTQHVAPTREKFVATAREITVLIRSLRESRNRSMAVSIEEIQSLVIRLLSGVAFLGLVVAAVAIWRFRYFEKEREVHLQHLHAAELDLRSLSQSLVESQELERKKLSRELHDEVGQLLTALRVQLGQIEPVGQAAQPHLAQASDLAERSLRTVREMARGLRPAMLDDLGLAPALKWLGRDFSKNTVLDVDVEIEGELSGLLEPARTCLYRVAQEALTNCVKHSGATSARVMLHESPDEIVLTIQDNGRGFASGEAKGIGLLGMRERVEELNGRFAVISSPGTGTLIRANLPRTTI